VWVTGPFREWVQPSLQVLSSVSRMAAIGRGTVSAPRTFPWRTVGRGFRHAGRNDKGFGHESLSLFLADLLLISLSRSASESFCERKQLIQFSRSKRGHNTERLLPLFEPWRNTRL
jgi:hypothetical protein